MHKSNGEAIQLLKVVDVEREAESDCSVESYTPATVEMCASQFVVLFTDVRINIELFIFTEMKSDEFSQTSKRILYKNIQASPFAIDLSFLLYFI